MTHFPIVVLVGGPVDQVLTNDPYEGEVGQLLAPYDENGEWFAENSRWDWWVIGGRWDGAIGPWDKSECKICEGTGTAKHAEMPTDIQKMLFGGCEGCGGSGTAVDMKPGTNILPISEINREFTPMAVVTKDGWFEKGRAGWWGTEHPDEQGNEPKTPEQWEAVVKAIYEQHPDAVAVLVDCHV